MKQKFKPGDAVTTPDMTAHGIDPHEVGWVIRETSYAIDLYDVTFSLHPQHPDGRYWRVGSQALMLMEDQGDD